MDNGVNQSGPGSSRGLGAAKTAHRAGGNHRNPGPNGPRRPPAGGNKQARTGPASQQNITRAVVQYRLTEIYKRGRDAKYPGAAQLQRFNNWVRANVAQIDPAEQRVCHICGTVDFYLCDCCITQGPAAPPPPPPPAPIYHAETKKHPWYVRWFYNVPPAPQFNMGEQNGKNLAGFSNEYIDDREIVPQLYNYLTVNQQTSYAVSGQDSRALRLAHTHRLALRWAEKEEKMRQLENDTHFGYRFRLTIQRACDQAENNMLYEYTNPARMGHFGLAWLPKLVLILCLIVCLAALVVIAVDMYTFSELWPDTAAEEDNFFASAGWGGSSTD